MRSFGLVQESVPEAVLAVSPDVQDDVDGWRAQHYDLLAALLGRAPTGGLLAQIARLAGDGSRMGEAYAELAAAARGADAARVERAFFRLFIGVGRGELVPYGSYYLTGFLNERPLARVREDLDRLGIERSDAMSEPEDHIAILLETMAGLASGRFDTPPGSERAFFARHLEPWASRFFADLARSDDPRGGADDGVRFYRAVGALGRAYIEIESQAYALDA